MADSAFDEAQGVGLVTPEEAARLAAEAAQAEGCPQDFLPAREARPATRTQTATAKPRRQAKKKPTAQDELAVQDAYFASLKPVETSGVEAVQPMKFATLKEVATMVSEGYTVKWLLPAQGVVLLYGESGSLKSFSMFSCGVHISEGWSFDGRRVKRRPVYYLSLEGAGGQGKRIRGFNVWAQNAGKPELKGDFRFWLHGFALDKLDQCNALIKAILDAGHQGAVVIVDTLSQSTVGLDENSSQMAEAIGNATMIANAIGGLVILIHHLGKDTSKGPRGHSSLVGNVDCAISVTKDNGGVLWTVKKSKDEAEGQTVWFKIHVVDLGLDEDGDPVTTCVTEPSKRDRPKGSAVAEVLKPGSEAEKGFQNFLLALHEAKTEGVHIEEWRKVYYAKSTADSPNTKRNGFTRVRNKLVKLGVLAVDNDVYTLTPEFQHRLQADTATPTHGSDTATHP
ncbi:MAG: AAA family ATPase [Desulfovibrio sp.]|nr:AAA family ATPase [Desulfovibrio sp.]